MALTYVSATVMAKDGCEAALERELAKVVAAVRAEDGCIRYDLHRSEYGNVFLFYEIWESPAHLAAHLRTPHMDSMREATADLVTGVAEVNLWEAVDVAV
ncbi:MULTISPECIES: putative quinol monooxygenase [unclassified Pseudodesulfovibrio]|uniref:putative quinol monooxygenase n=1 Tax=unclassified Pseudodesulfovibrio TaxID=2661612 RepID=UPI000FEB9F20|nr:MULTISPECIES: putative quinol monooxygenase [unclassified Pseudodesulfovibrio]MCJ2163624.1 antibiotic biosynthesis monooxygenase [Pseudodesulfovibrio sp. S3-i]RWU06853.1 antibiotic biosynthesis monooxygenase [Pseudodesulfovibrio sp. S3]